MYLNHIFIIRDDVASVYGQVFIARTVRQAVRIFKGALSSPNLKKDNFSLWHVANIDLEDGHIVPSSVQVDFDNPDLGLIAENVVINTFGYDDDKDSVSPLDTELTE